jgi:Rhs element Vgr protein
MPQSPQLNSDGPIRLTVEAAGRAVPDSVQFYRATVRRAVGKVPTAELVVADGEMPTGDWPVANGETFAPGTEITIRAGYGDKDEPIFKGLVVKLGMRIDGDNASRLHVYCQDKAVKMTVGRKCANYLDKSDSQIISTLASNHGLSVDVDSTDAVYGELVQYDCTDWDFMVARAEANGLLVIADDGQLSVKAPQTDGTAQLSVGWGTDLVSFQAEIDARSQLSNVAAVAWDPKTQAQAQGSASPQALNEQGNLKAGTLAEVVGAKDYTLRTAATLASDALNAWAKGRQVKAGLARIRGRMKFRGSAKAKVGELIELSGVGERYSGSVLVSGLEHQLADGAWFTQADFGLDPEWFTERQDVSSPHAAGWLPGADGLQVGVVTQLADDPKGEQRIKVKTPVMDAESEGVWARLIQYSASKDFGSFFIPEVGDEVVLGYFNNDPSNPVVLGSLYSSNRAPPYTITAENNIRSLVTRSKSKIEIDDKDVVITIITTNKNKVVISDKDKSIELNDENGNKLKMSPSGVTIDSPKDIKLTASGGISLQATGSITVTAQADVSVKGLNVQAEAQVAFTGKGAASAELSANGQTTVRGALVMIN